MTLKRVSVLLSATTLASIGLSAHAGGLSPVVNAEDVAANQVTQIATISGSTNSGAYSITPEWSDEQGFSVTGSMGYVMDEGSAVGVIVTAGERKREALVNFGLTIDAQRQIILTAGQLQEKLEFGTAGEQEWVKQCEFVLAYDATSYSVTAYHVDSETTDNFVGAKSSGVEVNGSPAVSNVATLDCTAGYQSLKWDDGIADEDGLTAGFNLGYQANADTVVNLFAGHNVSENRYGVGASWRMGTGSLDASYTYIDGLVGSITDDSQFEVAFNLPLGGSTSSTATADATTSGLSSVSAAKLLADVMQRPAYILQRVIVKEATGERFDILACTYVDFSTNEPDNDYDLSSISYLDF